MILFSQSTGSSFLDLLLLLWYSMLALPIFGVLKVLGLTLWIVALWLGLRWVNANSFSWWRAILSGLLVTLGFQFVAGLTMNQLVALGIPPVAVWGLVALFYAAGTFLLVASLFQLSPQHSILASLPTFVAPGISLLLLSLVVQPYFLQAFKITSSAMNPTLLGNHFEAECPECGAIRYGTAPRVYSGPEVFENIEMICDNFHVSQGCPPTDDVHTGDRILVSKLDTPQRWDLLVFQYPKHPEEIFVMRLVGMPGETIHIENGAVYADGKPLSLPSELNALHYEDQMEGLSSNRVLWGTVDEPAALADDEYFVLGDFTRTALDSRLWTSPSETGVSPYAVPRQNIVGVATEIYWPIHRWRTFP